MITKYIDFKDIRGKEKNEIQDIYIINYGDKKYLYKTQRENDISYIGLKLKDKTYYNYLIEILDIIYAKYKTDDYIFFSIENIKAKMDYEDLNFQITTLEKDIMKDIEKLK